MAKAKQKKPLDKKKARRDPCYFVEQLLTVNLHDFQKAVMRDPKDRENERCF